jgi:hypothetical protein
LTRTNFGYLLHEESVYVNHKLWWDLVIPELLKHDTDYHEILDVVWPNDEAGWWYFLHRSGGGRLVSVSSRIEK